MPTLTINGQSHNVDVEPDTPLLVGVAGERRPDRHQIRLRHRAMRRLHGAHRRRRDALLLDAGRAVAGKQITTIEGLAVNGVLTKVQQAWLDHDVPQCGYCQSGMIMAVTALLKEKPKPTDADIDDAITNICRCGTYQQVRAAIHAAASA